MPACVIFGTKEIYRNGGSRSQGNSSRRCRDRSLGVFGWIAKPVEGKAICEQVMQLCLPKMLGVFHRQEAGFSHLIVFGC